MIRGVVSPLAVLAICLSIANAQMLIPLYGACTSSVQCVGVAICFNHVCQCPPVYNAVGITCVYAGLEGELMQPPAPIVPGPPPPGYPVPPPPVPGYPPGPPVPGFPPGPPLPIGPGAPPPPLGPGVQIAPAFPVSQPLPVPAAGAPFAYPGLPCSPAKSCMGNSVCVQGTCGCPAGQVVVGYSCVAPQRVLAGGPVPAPGPFAPVAPRPGAPYYPVPPFPGPIDRLPGEDNLDFLFGAAGLPPPGVPAPGAPVGGPYPGPFPYPAGPGPIPGTCPPSQVPLGPECFPPAAIVNYPSPVACQPAVPAPCGGGAACVGAVCACPAPLVWAGNACTPPPPLGPPPPPAPGPYPAVILDKFIPAPSPYGGPYPGPLPALPIRPAAVLPAAPVAVQAGPVPAPLALGSACNAHNQCVVGAFCQLGVCQCRPAFLPYGSICVLRRRAKDEVERSHSEKTEKHD